ncbi:MAG: hypothetical protein DME10_15375 [Candidatus Rokuibacteriota bacterium]|nr:MAG: hypothetical protein DME10_15375 [Candidatus Rokubacteria bacterium]
MGHMVRTVRLDMPEMIPPHCLGRRASASLTEAHSNRGRSLVMKKYQLMAPGPTPVPSEVLLAMARPIIHHRAPQYDALFREVREALKRLVQTREDVLTPACTGTGAMEAAVSNTLSAGDRVIVVNAGAFAQRWLAICKAYGLNVVELEAPHGETVAAARIAEALRANPGVKAVLVQHSESSTGVLHDVRAYAQVTGGTEAILIVDAVSSLGIADLTAADRRAPGPWVPSHMSSIAQLIREGGLDVLLTAGTDMLNSFSDAASIERDLEKVGLIVAYDLFANDTTRRVADIVLPGTVWLEDIGIKETATHLYLMEKALEPAGQARPLISVLRELASRLDIMDFFPWADLEAYVDALLAPQRGGDLTVARFRDMGGIAERSRLSHVPYQSGGYATPSRRVEFYSERAIALGLPAMPGYTTPAPDTGPPAHPLEFRQGRVLTAFHSFYDNGRALPMLARAEPHAEIWIHPADASPRGIADGRRIELSNDRGRFEGVARVTEDVLPGVVWARDGWPGLNGLTSGEACLTPEASEGLDPRIPGGQSAYEARVEARLLPV